MRQVTARISRDLPEMSGPVFGYRLRGNDATVQKPRLCAAPVQMRKLKYHVSVSADGFILRELDGFNGFATQGDTSEQYLRSLHAYGIALMGRGTYELGLKLGIDDPYPHLMSYVFSRTPRRHANTVVEWVSEDATQWVRRLKSCPGKDLYLRGGAKLASSLLQAGLVDEIILKITPLLKGSEQRLLSGLDHDVELTRESSVACEDGIVMLSYSVQKKDTPVASNDHEFS